MEILKSSSEIVHSLGTRLVRGFTFWASGSFEENVNKIVGRFEEESITNMEFNPNVFASISWFASSKK